MSINATAVSHPRPWLTGYSGRAVAITGATGFIGSCTLKVLADADCRILPVDLRDPATCTGLLEADVVFHFAADTGTASSDEHERRSFEANVLPFRELLSMCAAAPSRPFIVFAGSVTQTGVPRTVPVSEDVPDNPVLPYDRHKLLSENDLKTAVADGRVSGTSLRLANVYGPGGHRQKRDRGVLNRMIRDAIGGRPLTVYGTGEYLRDYIYIEDVVNAFLMAGLCPEKLNGSHVVIGSGSGRTIAAAASTIADRVAAATGTRVPVTLAPRYALSALEQRQFVADPSRFIKATGWRPSWDFEDGVDRTIEAIRCE